MCGASLVWLGVAPVSSASGAEVFSIWLALGWAGLFAAVGCGIVGFLSWPFSPEPTRLRQDGAPSAYYYDDVTGLPTRRLFLALLKQALSRAEATKRNVAVLICTLEQFRPLSVSSAPPHVTLVVRVQAARIKSALQPHDVVARLGEYTFAVIADNLQSPADAYVIADKIQKTIALPLMIESQELLMSCRVGGIVGPRPEAEAESLLDAAMQVLENGRSTEENSTGIMIAAAPCSGRHEANLLPSIAGRYEAALSNHR